MSLLVFKVVRSGECRHERKEASTESWSTPCFRGRGKKAKERNRKVGGNLGARAVLEAKEVFQGGKSDQFYCMLLIGGAREELKIAS